MRKIKNHIYMESKFIGFHLGMVATNEGALLIDCPLKVEEAKEWLSLAGEYAKPRYLAFLDAHPDRVLGARSLDLPLIAQDRTLEMIREWSDTFKGNLHPIGAESDRLKRVTGVHRVAPEITFSERMVTHLGGIEIQFLHRPGPQPGSAWIVVPEKKTAFIGDAVTPDEPPYIGVANLKRWMDGLDELRQSPMEDFTLLSSQGGPIDREHINAMARFIRKVEYRLEKIAEEDLDEQQIGQLAEELIEDFKPSNARHDQAILCLQVGLADLASSDSLYA